MDTAVAADAAETAEAAISGSEISEGLMLVAAVAEEVLTDAEALALEEASVTYSFPFAVPERLPQPVRRAVPRSTQRDIVNCFFINYLSIQKIL